MTAGRGDAGGLCRRLGDGGDGGACGVCRWIRLGPGRHPKCRRTPGLFVRATRALCRPRTIAAPPKPTGRWGPHTRVTPEPPKRGAWAGHAGGPAGATAARPLSRTVVGRRVQTPCAVLFPRSDVGGGGKGGPSASDGPGARKTPALFKVRGRITHLPPPPPSPLAEGEGGGGRTWAEGPVPFRWSGLLGGGALTGGHAAVFEPPRPPDRLSVVGGRTRSTDGRRHLTAGGWRLPNGS